MRELKPISDAGDPGIIVLVAARSGAEAERFALPVTDELRALVAAAPGSGGTEPVTGSLDDVSATPPPAAARDAEGDSTGAGAPDAGAGDSVRESAQTDPAVVELREPTLVLRPREIQDRVRAGASVEELLELTGMPVRRIEAFAHPVLSERARIAELGKASRPRRADGPAALSLWEILATAFAARGLDLSDSRWDAWRDPAGQWIIGVTWRAGHSETTAEWAFHSEGATTSTVARNTIAAELVDPDFARPRRNLSSVGERPGEDASGHRGDHGGPGIFGDHGDVGDHGDHGDQDADDEFLRHPDDDASPKRRRKTVMPSWEDVLLGVRPTDRK